MQNKTVSLLQLFVVFAKIGAFTIGGGYAMIAIIQNEILKRKWMDEEEFTELITLSQTAPGLLAVNIAIFTGYRLRGIKGSFIATLASILPSFLIILLIASLFKNFQDNQIVVNAFKGIRPVVVALILVPMINMALKNNKTWWKWLISAAILILVGFLKLSPVLILLLAILFSLCISIYQTKKQEGKK